MIEKILHVDSLTQFLAHRRCLVNTTEIYHKNSLILLNGRLASDICCDSRFVYFSGLEY